MVDSKDTILKINRAWTMASRPIGEPKPENFDLKESEIPPVKHGEILLRTLFLSLDPYMRGRMHSGPSYATPLEPGEVMQGEVVARVERSKAKDFSEGAIVRSSIGWQEWGIIPAHLAKPVDLSLGPISTALGVLGMPGLTAYFGLQEICQPKAGDTLVVSAASGAVGAVVGQLGKINGCFVIGVAGSYEKCTHVTDDLGFDASVNYKTEDISKRFKELSPTGINAYFDNVGGPVLDAVMDNLADSARIAICGQISQYNAVEMPQGPRNIGALLRSRSRVQGFLVYDFERKHEIARKKLAGWIKNGRLKYKEDIVDGFENAPIAFIGLLRGENFGKLIIKVSDLD